MDPIDFNSGRSTPPAGPAPTPPAAMAAPAAKASPSPAFAADWRLAGAPGPDRAARPGLIARTWGAIAGLFRDLFAPMWRSAAFAPPQPPPDRGGLRVASYNILLGGQRLDAAIRDLQRLDADVICLQETSRAATEAIARTLGLHVAFYAQRGPVKGSLKAILSRYPIEEAEDRRYPVPLTQRLGVVADQLKARNWSLFAEPLEGRSLLRATIRVGDRRIDILDTHLSLGDGRANASQIAALADYVAARKAEGRTVIAAGDFNANLALATRPGRPPAADAAGRYDTPTDTLAEFRDRYGVGPGNIARPDVQAAASRLLGTMRPHWDAPDRSVIVEGAPLTPEQARAELAAGRAPVGSARHKQLLLAMDGATHLGARKRFDHVLATPDVRMASALVDQSATGSDHQPVLAEVRWD